MARRVSNDERTATAGARTHTRHGKRIHVPWYDCFFGAAAAARRGMLTVCVRREDRGRAAERMRHGACGFGCDLVNERAICAAKAGRVWHRR